jgi:hypothetical protein
MQHTKAAETNFTQNITAFLDVTPCNLMDGINILGENFASIFEVTRS